MDELSITTKAKIEFIDITKKLELFVANTGTKQGLLFCYLPHTTAALIINESYDPSVAADIQAILTKLVPQHTNYKHLEGNSQAHILSSLLGTQVIAPIENGKLGLGSWQGVFFVELDGPRERKIKLKIIKG